MQTIATEPDAGWAVRRRRRAWLGDDRAAITLISSIRNRRK